MDGCGEQPELTVEVEEVPVLRQQGRGVRGGEGLPAAARDQESTDEGGLGEGVGMGEIGLDRPALAERRRALGRHHLEPREMQRRHVALAQRSQEAVVVGAGAGGQDRRQRQRATARAAEEARAAGVAAPVAAQDPGTCKRQ